MAEYQADGERYGAYEDVGKSYPVCDVCGDVGGMRDAEKDCAECVAKWEADYQPARLPGDAQG